MAPRAPGGSVLGRLSLPAKFVFGLVLTLVVGALYFVVFFADIDGQISAAQGQRGALQAELAKAEEAKDAFQKDVEEKTRKQALEREQKKVLPDDAETPAFLSAVQQVATVSGVNLVSYKPEDEVAEDYYVRVPMSLAMRGRFHQIARFFYGVGQLDRVINVEDIEMRIVVDPNASPEEVILEVRCLATAFRAKRDGEGGGAAAGGRRRN
ncbi:MAG: type 4a pilus biogenesis protein PilO [Myxococcales bacterium]|nr:type 4a pilus biogenesis protein PilO [Myxococcales bacterium]